MQVILGAGGPIANGIAKLLPDYTDKIRLVSRNPKKVNEKDELFQANLLDLNAVMEAVKGSEVVYLAAGLKYDIEVWRKDWLIIMKNVLAACKWANTKLVFFDNVYSLGKVEGWMKESTPMNPASKKGDVRKQLNELILDAISKGNVNAIIARSADFYGPNSPLAVVNMLLLEKYAKGKRGQILISDKFKHSYTYTPDAAKGMVLLGNTPSAYNRIWHLPTDSNVLRGKEFAELAAKIMDVPAKYSIISKGMLSFLGLFKKELKEVAEMAYQNNSDYLFDSSDFEKTFGFLPTPYLLGLEETAVSMKNLNKLKS